MAQAMILRPVYHFVAIRYYIAEVIVVVIFNLARLLIKLFLQKTAHNKNSVMT